MAPVEMAPSTGTSHVACRHCDWRQRTAYRRLQHLQLCGRSWKAPLEVAIWVKKKVVAVEREVAGGCLCVESGADQFDQWHLRRHAHRAYKLGLVQLMVTSCGCNPSMFQNMFGMGNQIENYTLDEQCRHIKVKNKYQRKLFLYFGNFVWEPYTPTVMAALPQICVVGSVAWFAVVPLICFHVVEWHQPDRVLRQYGLQQPIPGCPSQPQNLHGITLKGKQDENWFHLLAPIISQWNNAAQFRVDVYPRQQGLLGFNSDYMVWYRRKTKMFVDPNNANTAALGEVVETLQYMVSPQGRNTWIVDDLVPYVDKLAIISEEQERVTEPVSHGPASEREFPAPEFHILQSSVETRGLGRRR
ncbi:uncharacterized protein [Glycine max]|uniref:uncharacterized protein n=1 Tax=Glycine max TaxID=3847 RepID=UPI001B356D04|nr:uncharacterized protein LOC102663698 [Glycine max]